jgi:hypothetical protein
VGLVGLAQAEKPIKHRFSVLSKDTTWVLDHTTALQWQKTPGNEPTRSWQVAHDYCSTLGADVRLPEVKELLSLVDYSMFQPALPEGHPFVNVQPVFYWSETALAENSSLAWLVEFASGHVSTSEKSVVSRTWCVR